MEIKELKNSERKKRVDFRYITAIIVGILIALGGTAFSMQADEISQPQISTQAYYEPTPNVLQEKPLLVAESMEPSETIIGGTDTDDYRCVVFMEPIQLGEKFSKVSEEVCGTGRINAVGAQSLNSSYLIAQFYTNRNYSSLSYEVFGPERCADGFSYGDEDSGLVDWSSARTYSTCDALQVFDGIDFTGPHYSCGPYCSSFFSLNGNIESWHLHD